MSVAHDVIANTVAGRLELIRANESLRSQLAKCAAARANLERRILELTHERDAALKQLSAYGKPKVFA